MVILVLWFDTSYILHGEIPDDATKAVTEVLFHVMSRSLWSCCRIKHRKLFSDGLRCFLLHWRSFCEFEQPHHYPAEFAENLENQLVSGPGGERQLPHCRQLLPRWEMLHALVIWIWWVQLERKKQGEERGPTEISVKLSLQERPKSATGSLRTFDCWTSRAKRPYEVYRDLLYTACSY